MAEEKKITTLEALEALARELKKRVDKVEKDSSVYRPAGNLSQPDYTKLTKENLGCVYNITQQFTADGKHFVGSDTNTYPAGTDIAVVAENDELYRFNVLSGFVDLSDYPTTSNVTTMIDTKLDAEIVSIQEVEEMLKDVFGEDALR